MQIGLVGLSYSGKTTLFQLLTGMKQSSSLQGKANHGMVKVPDSRVDYLSALYKPKKNNLCYAGGGRHTGLDSGSGKVNRIFSHSGQGSRRVGSCNPGFREPGSAAP